MHSQDGNLRLLLCVFAWHDQVYDGDTPQHERDDIRMNAQLLITNPDMLHMSILPVHSQFSRLLSNLQYVVLDEAHAYHGIFGCHTALVMRRLRRLCERLYHRRPCFIMTSATISNPKEHAQRLVGVPSVALVDQDGSPHGPKQFVLWNPPLKFSPQVSTITSKAFRIPSATDLSFFTKTVPFLYLSGSER